ncbi:MAG: DUF374 domain-containing protein [Proteobacteria bacterium]|nr:DUF374 domain-containing protein [Pseudomonadota bacterium]
MRHTLRTALGNPLARLAALVLPPLYMLYMRLVWSTSRVDEGGYEQVRKIIAENDGAVALLWHEEVLTVGWGYPYVGVRPHTLVSPSDAGEVLTRILERCGYHVVRGGTTSHRSRRRAGVLEEMKAHMRDGSQVLYGLTVDGSKGPPYRMKKGGITIARDCGVPILLFRTWYRRCLRLRSWDRTAVPLPWNEIVYSWRGPYTVPDDANTRAGLNRFRHQLENDLIDLAAQSYDDLGQPRPAKLQRRAG